MILIADSGSTKTTWCVINDNKLVHTFHSEGFNPFFVDSGFITTSLSAAIPTDLPVTEVSHIHFYGAGCYPDNKPILENGLAAVFPKTKVLMELDLLAAAPGLLGRSRGFAAILGTGTNTCQYNGREITLNIDSLGFTLGDEGSGAWIGKTLLRDYLRGYMPEAVQTHFTDTFKLTIDGVLHQIYAQPRANRYCAGFCSFIGENIHQPYYRDLVKSAFAQFFKNLVSRYPSFQQDSFNCIGSIAFYFEDLLTETASEFGMPVGRISRSPMEGLVDYHSQLS